MKIYIFSKGKFTIKMSKDRRYYFVLQAPNGETILTSETYQSKQMAKKGIAAIQKYANAKVVDETF